MVRRARRQVPHLPRLRRQWGGVLVGVAALGTLVGTAGHAGAAQPKWVAANIPTEFPTLACPVPGFCLGAKDGGPPYKAVGDAVVGTYSGDVWHETALPLSGLTPPAARNPAIEITGLSCPSRGRCVLVGTYIYGVGERDALIATLSGGKWTSITAPLSGLTGDNAPASVSDFLSVYLGGFLCNAELQCPLSALSCPTVSFCLAVGLYDTVGFDGQGGQATLVETYQGGRWTASALPDQNLGPPEGQGLFTFSALDCASVEACVAVGDYGPVNGTLHDFAETLSNGKWSSSVGPVVATGRPYQPIELSGVITCPERGYCVLERGHSLMSFSAGKWTTYTDPHISTAWGPLSCPTKEFCAAVSSNLLATNYLGILENGKLTGYAVPNLGAVVDVSCAAKGKCVAVGSAVPAGLIETLSGRVWTMSQAPFAGLRPAARFERGTYFTLTRVSCASTSWCLALGGYTVTPGKTTPQYAFSERESE